MQLTRCLEAPLPAAAALISAIIFTGCAGTPPPTADLTRAQTLVDQADQSGAARYASAAFSSAQDKVQQADRKAKGDPAQAARLANEASVDAELALARTRANKEQDALQQINSSLDALRHQVTSQQATGEQQGGSPP